MMPIEQQSVHTPLVSGSTRQRSIWNCIGLHSTESNVPATASSAWNQGVLLKGLKVGPHQTKSTMSNAP